MQSMAFVFGMCCNSASTVIMTASHLISQAHFVRVMGRHAVCGDRPRHDIKHLY